LEDDSFLFGASKGLVQSVFALSFREGNFDQNNASPKSWHIDDNQQKNRTEKKHSGTQTPLFNQNFDKISKSLTQVAPLPTYFSASNQKKNTES